MIAETSFQVKIAAMHQKNQSENAKDQIEVLFERFKIEDEIFFEFGIEVEHFVMLRHEQINLEEGESNISLESDGEQEELVKEALKKFEE